MIYKMKWMAPLAIVALITATSCGDTKTDAKEQSEIKKMDSTSEVLKENTEKLEDQTKKVEADLEKLDAESEAGK